MLSLVTLIALMCYKDKSPHNMALLLVWTVLEAYTVRERTSPFHLTLRHAWFVVWASGTQLIESIRLLSLARSFPADRCHDSCIRSRWAGELIEDF